MEGYVQMCYDLLLPWCDSPTGLLVAEDESICVVETGFRAFKQQSMTWPFSVGKVASQKGRYRNFGEKVSYRCGTQDSLVTTGG